MSGATIFWIAIGALGLVYALPDLFLHRLGLWTVTSSRDGDAVSLTFDDGPDPVFTPPILDELKRRGFRATFFVLGEKAQKCPQLLERMATEGHEIAIHGWDHRHPWLLGPVICGRHLRRTLATIRPYWKGKTRYRPPWGFWSVWNVLGSRGFNRTMWSIPGNDWVKGATPESVAQGVLDRIEGGSIVLLHDGGKYSSVTVAALPLILRGIAQKGLRATTVAEMSSTVKDGSLERDRASIIKAAARRLQGIQEERFARSRHLISCGDNGFLRIEPLVFDGSAVSLKDGTQILKGDRIADIHLDSRKIAELYREGSAMKARVLMFRDAEASFKWIANWLRQDEVGQKTAALRSITLLERELAHFGFEIHRLPAWPWILTGLYMQWLNLVYRSGSRGEANAKRRTQRKPRGVAGYLESLTPKVAWMSRSEFIEKYGA